MMFSHWGTRPRKNSEIHIDVSHSRQPLVKGERLVRYEVNTVMHVFGFHGVPNSEVNGSDPLLGAVTTKKLMPTRRRKGTP
jgi:hypothetical protein